MGWLWDTSAAKAAADKSVHVETSFTIPTTENTPPASPATPTDTSTQTSTSSRTSTPPAKPVQAEPDFTAILAEFSTPATPSSSPSQSQSQSQSSSSSAPPSDNASWTPSILHPSSMSCTSAFDQAMFCQIVGGQFVNYYRYGALRNCSELWSNFWFCMRTNRGFMDDQERERRVQAFYMAREARRKSEGSSEDVWTAREEEDIRPWAERQFRWDLRRYEQGQRVLRARSE